MILQLNEDVGGGRAVDQEEVQVENGEADPPKDESQETSRQDDGEEDGRESERFKPEPIRVEGNRLAGQDEQGHKEKGRKHAGPPASRLWGSPSAFGKAKDIPDPSATGHRHWVKSS